MRDWRKGGSVWTKTREVEGTGERRRVRKDKVSGGELGWCWESNHRAAALSGEGEERRSWKRGRHCSIASLVYYSPSQVLKRCSIFFTFSSILSLALRGKDSGAGLFP